MQDFFLYYIYLLIPVLLAVIKLVCLLIAIAYYTLAERKIMAAFQRRVGPNVVGPLGLLQPLADGLKLAGKEFVIPSHSNSRIFIAAAMATLMLALVAWTAIPLNLFDFSGRLGRQTALYAAVNILTPHMYVNEILQTPKILAWKILIEPANTVIFLRNDGRFGVGPINSHEILPWQVKYSNFLCCYADVGAALIRLFRDGTYSLIPPFDMTVEEYLVTKDVLTLEEMGEAVPAFGDSADYDEDPDFDPDYLSPEAEAYFDALDKRDASILNKE